MQYYCTYMKTALYNCKRCKIGRRVSYTESQRSHIGYGRYQVSHWRIGEHGERVYPGSMLISGNTYGGDGACPNCHRQMKWGWLDAHKVDDVPCDARCTGARGHSCECSCGGENHGKDWSSLGRQMSEILAA